MVKFKSRYILMEILQGNSNTDKLHHSIRIKTEVLADRIQKDTSLLYGDLGLGQLRTNFQVKYLNEITNLIIIRISRDFFKNIHTLLCLMTKIDQKEIRIRIIHISGTIKKIEEISKKVLSSWIETFELENSNQDTLKTKEKFIKLVK